MLLLGQCLDEAIELVERRHEAGALGLGCPYAHAK